MIVETALTSRERSASTASDCVDSCATDRWELSSSGADAHELRRTPRTGTSSAQTRGARRPLRVFIVCPIVVEEES
jgi:hypothetical protein